MNFVSRSQWGARQPTKPYSAITSEGTTAHWEGGGIWGGRIGDHASCATKVRGIQAYHMDHQGWSDIAYNVVVCPHGYVFEGRGPRRRSAANGTNTSNGRSAVACYLGGVGDPFTDEAKQAYLDAAEYLEGALKWGHRDWYQTQCPGDEIYNWVHAGHILTGPPLTPPTTTGQRSDKMQPFLVKRDNDANQAVFVCDGMFRRWLPFAQNVTNWQRYLQSLGLSADISNWGHLDVDVIPCIGMDPDHLTQANTDWLNANKPK